MESQHFYNCVSKVNVRLWKIYKSAVHWRMKTFQACHETAIKMLKIIIKAAAKDGASPLGNPH